MNISEMVSCGCAPGRRRMGIVDITQKEYFTDEERFADFVNAVCFNGRGVIKPEELENIPETVRKADEVAVLERTCDVVKKCTKDGTVFAIYVMENQKTVDYRMPVRVMLEESLRYDSQIKQIAKKNLEAIKNSEEEEAMNDGEFLYGFRKTDRLMPVYTMVIYWGDGEWDGATSLRELVAIPGEDKEVRQMMLGMIPDYKIRVYDLNKEKDFSAFNTTLRTVFEFYSRHDDGNSLKEYIEKHREEVDNLDRESKFFLSKMLKDRDLTKVLRNNEKNKGNKKEGAGMCKAIDELREMSRQEGIAQGIERGRAELKAELEDVREEKERIIFLLQQKIEKLEGQLALKAQ